MQVYGAGGKTVPKRGRLGTGSYYPAGTPIFGHRGNVFAGLITTKTAADELSLRTSITGRDSYHSWAE